VSLWRDAGVSIDCISDCAGHSRGGITQRYRHLRDDRMAADLQLVDAYLTKAAEAVRLDTGAV
jgi:integrase